MSFFTRAGYRVRKRIVFAIGCIVIVVVLFIIAGLFGVNRSVQANVAGFGAGIYWDQGCTNRTLSFDWGSIETGSNKTFTVYVQNEGDSAASLSMTSSNWIPSSAPSYMTLNWNYTGQILNAGQAIPLQLILAVSPSATGITQFSFDTIIATTS